MSAPPDLAETAPASSGDLARLRAELDRLDDALQDLLIERAHAVARVAAFGGKGRVALRPGREAAIIRRLLARHSGPLAPQALVRIWRELLAGTTAMQGPHRIAVCDARAGCGLTRIAHEHFGALTPLAVFAHPADALAEARSGEASAAVLPLPSDAEPAADAWWPGLLREPETGQSELRVVARLPFWRPRPEGAPAEEAFVVSPVAPDPSGQDRSLVGIEAAPDLSRERLRDVLARAGLFPAAMLLRLDGGAGAEVRALIEVDGFMGDNDPRLAGAGAELRSLRVIGAYAVPVGEDAA